MTKFDNKIYLFYIKFLFNCSISLKLDIFSEYIHTYIKIKKYFMCLFCISGQILQIYFLVKNKYLIIFSIPIIPPVTGFVELLSCASPCLSCSLFSFFSSALLFLNPTYVIEIGNLTKFDNKIYLFYIIFFI